MVTVSPSSVQLMVRTERLLQGPWVHEGEGSPSFPLTHVLPVGRPSAICVNSSGPAACRTLSAGMSSGKARGSVCTHSACCSASCQCCQQLQQQYAACTLLMRLSNRDLKGPSCFVICSLNLCSLLAVLSHMVMHSDSCSTGLQAGCMKD